MNADHAFTFTNTMAPGIDIEKQGFKFIVNCKSQKKIENGVFYLQDLQTALKVAKDGDKILIEEGEYGIENGYFEVKKFIEICGQGYHKTVLKGNNVYN